MLLLYDSLICAGFYVGADGGSDGAPLAQGLCCYFFGSNFFARSSALVSSARFSPGSTGLPLSCAQLAPPGEESHSISVMDELVRLTGVSSGFTGLLAPCVRGS